jgi:hypothetical protein
MMYLEMMLRALMALLVIVDLPPALSFAASWTCFLISLYVGGAVGGWSRCVLVLL